MTENEYKRKVMLAMYAGKFRVQAHEDRISRNIPDLSFAGHGCDGWIEVKHLSALPHRFFPTGDYFTFGQQRWLEEMGQIGNGYCFLLVGIGAISPKFALFRWSVLRNLRGRTWAMAKQACNHVHGAGRAIAVALHNGGQLSAYQRPRPTTRVGRPRAA